ncbi:heat-inducible transcriptional repressor HrcA [Caldisalinibacter kiritimatiensis]|uniref:Heat-inducible transcription repressor HrcA n=1 Tax=Caldisalinibacter kiritimatiensis TaxID=1304284 RepID=R1ATX3_9FIRM|nr:heat-inducible transcriptional repressor HrcA [Caldisalinibacter kiritimatiensis]EOD00583.1 Heat-inducible transcription repressor HrcA [Caldisalinibacter kiritimatiensis]
MKLDDRKLRILQAIIHSYITNAEPVGSRTISKKYDLGVSSATIRNEMSDLEELGYLIQPYTSAGRIPSDKAYRLYVDSLMEEKLISQKVRNQVRNQLLREIGEIDSLIQNVAKILSQLTNYTSLAIAPQVKQSRLKHIQLVPVNQTKVLVVIVTDTNIIKNTIFRVDKELSCDQLNKISNILNEKIKGHRIYEIGEDLQVSLMNEMYDLRETIKSTINSIVPLINQSLDKTEEVTLYADGVTNIFNFPEYNDVSKAKSFLSFLEDKNSVVDMMLKSGEHDIEITIGSENRYREVQNCSLITATYRLNGKTIGRIGVIGPTRMDYSKVISAVKSIALDMNEILNKYYIK